jgi:hypothetical protein
MASTWGDARSMGAVISNGALHPGEGRHRETRNRLSYQGIAADDTAV